MNIFLRQLLVIILIILSALGIYFGAYLPWVKSRAYINALKTMSGGGVQSLGDYFDAYDKAVKLYSPIGEEEIAKFLVNDIMNLISTDTQSEEASNALVEYAEPLLFKNNVRHLLLGGRMYYILWMRFGDKKNYEKAGVYYRQAFELGPKLPPVLYGLLQFYQDGGETEKFEEVRKIIRGYWPEDDVFQSVIEKVEK